MILLLSCLSCCETEIVLHFQEVGCGGRAQELENLHMAALSSNMDGSITDIVLFEQLADEDLATHKLLECIKGVVLSADVEDGLILVIPQLEVLFCAVEILFQHGNVIVLQCVVEGQVTVVVADVGARPDLIDNRVLLADADNMLNSLAFVVLLTTGLEELVATGEPVEDVLVAIAGTDEKRVLTKVVHLLECLVFVLLKDFKHLHVLGLHSNEKRALAFEIRLHALIRAHGKKLLSQLMLTRSGSHVKWCVTFESITAIEDVKIGECF